MRRAQGDEKSAYVCIHLQQKKDRSLSRLIKSGKETLQKNDQERQPYLAKDFRSRHVQSILHAKMDESLYTNTCELKATCLLDV